MALSQQVARPLVKSRDLSVSPITQTDAAPILKENWEEAMVGGER